MNAKFLLIPLAVLALGCSSAKTDSTGSEDAPIDSFPLPVIPTELREPAQRANFAVEHFWDSALWPDSTSPAMEQAFANFIGIAEVANDSASLCNSLCTLMQTAPNVDAVMEVAEHYLYDPDSPMRNEELFIRFLLHAPHNARREALMEQALKNRVGTVAPDFVTRNARTGRQSQLSSLVKGETLVYFFDSKCNVCRSLIPKVEDMAQGRRVIAVCPASEDEEMDDALVLMPESWIVVTDTGEIDRHSLYEFPALPSLYILAPDMTILAKDARI